VSFGQRPGFETVVTKISDREKNAGTMLAMKPPYNWFKKITLDSNYGVPDSIQVLEMRNKNPGKIKIRLTNSSTDTIYSDTCDMFLLDVDTIFKLGTDSLLRTGSIYLYGLVK
jgi:hypothetical protein